MDSLVNNYTADKKKRSDDNTPHGVAERPDQLFWYIHNDAAKLQNVPIVIGGIEASLRHCALIIGAARYGAQF